MMVVVPFLTRFVFAWCDGVAWIGILVIYLAKQVLAGHPASASGIKFAFSSFCSRKCRMHIVQE